MNGTHTLHAWSDEAHRERDKLLAALALPKSVTVSDRSVSAMACRAVLYRIAAHAGPDEWCFASLDTLAGETALSRRTVARVIEALERLQIVERSKRKTPESRLVCNHYRIDWAAVEARGRRQRHPDAEPSVVPPGARSATVAPCCETQRSATVAPPLCHSGTSVVPPGPSTWCYGDGVNKSPAPTHHPPPAARPDGAGVSKIRWGRKITPEELLTPAAVLPELFGSAVLHGVCRDSEAERIAFAALLAYALRQKVAANRFGLFTALLTGRHRDRFSQSRDWRGRPTQADEEQGRQWWAAADRDQDESPDPPDQYTAAAAAENEERRAFERRRFDQLKALQLAVARGELAAR